MLNIHLTYRSILIVVAFFVVLSCNTTTESNASSTDSEGYDKGNLNKNYDWTGTYELKDATDLYTLKLHKRSVDGSYEMQFYNNGKEADVYKSSIYDAKDDNTSICIRYLNNFQMDASSLGFKSGDTLFSLHWNQDSDTTFFKAFQPVNKGLKWIKISNRYN